MADQPPDPWYADALVCPVDRTPLRWDGRWLISPVGRRYPVVGGTPVLLPDADPDTLWVMSASRRAADAVAAGERPPHDLFADTLGLTDAERAGLAEVVGRGHSAANDPVVSYLICATNGIAYRHLVGRLPTIPIPSLRLPPGNGRLLLDVGCNWGRWTLAAAGRGYQAVGIDPSLGAVKAAERQAARMSLAARFVVGDARRLPFRDGLFDDAFSYSVFQHFSRADAAAAVAEAGRVVRPGGRVTVQMPTVAGLRCLYHQARRRFREPDGFEVRYYTLPALRRMFAAVGPTRVSVDCYFGIGLQPSDRSLYRPIGRAAVSVSEGLRAVSRLVPPLKLVADSVYLTAVKPGAAG